MNELKKITSSAYGFSGGCLISAALTFFESPTLSLALFIFAVLAFLLAEAFEHIFLPVYAASLRKRAEVKNLGSPAVTITGFIEKERLK